LPVLAGLKSGELFAMSISVSKGVISAVFGCAPPPQTGSDSLTDKNVI